MIHAEGDPRSRLRAALPLVLLFWATSLASCRAPNRQELPPEWFDVTSGGAGREEEAGDPVDDGFYWGLGGGYDFVRGTPLRAGFEIGAAYSAHDVNTTISGDSDPEMDVWRIYLGARMQTDLGKHLSMHVRGGTLWRSEEVDDLPGLENDQFGAYVGAGVEWWFDTDATFGPFVMYSTGGEDDLEEWVVGMAARFYFDSKAWDF